MNTIELISDLLKSRKVCTERILNTDVEKKYILKMLMLSIVLFSIYGFIIGCSQSIVQGISSAIKLPMMFYLNTLICFPTLYFFLSFLGIKQNLKQLFTFLILCNTFIALVLASFAPVTFFFLITDYSYTLFKFINCVIFAIAGFTGTYLFYHEIKQLVNGISQEPDEKKQLKGMVFLRLWAILFCIIGVQLSFTLSPFFGLPNEAFMLFTNENSNFFSDILKTINRLGQ